MWCDVKGNLNQEFITDRPWRLYPKLVAVTKGKNKEVFLNLKYKVLSYVSACALPQLIFISLFSVSRLLPVAKLTNIRTDVNFWNFVTVSVRRWIIKTKLWQFCETNKINTKAVLMLSFASASIKESTETKRGFKMQNVEQETGSRRSGAWLKVLWVTLHQILTGSLFGAAAACESVCFSSQLAWHVRAKGTWIVKAASWKLRKKKNVGL